MDSNLPYHIRLFNDRVRVLNQTNAKMLTLNPQEARNLHTEIYELLASIAELSKKTTNNNENISVNMDGGGFK